MNLHVNDSIIEFLSSLVVCILAAALVSIGLQTVLTSEIMKRAYEPREDYIAVPKPVLQEAYRRWVSIDAVSSRDIYAGTGTRMGGGKILTARHVIASAMLDEMLGYGPVEYRVNGQKAKILHASNGHDDTVLLQVPDDGFTPMPVFNGDPTPNTPVFMVGNPSSRQGVLYTGRVVALIKQDSGASGAVECALTPSVLPGTSGSGIFSLDGKYMSVNQKGGNDVSLSRLVTREVSLYLSLNPSVPHKK